MSTKFNKVLIAEDHESVNISLQKTLEDLGINKTDHVYYCDDALSRIQRSAQSSDPYDLLITDLSFEEDSRTQKISDGLQLIPAVRDIQPDLKILVFSAESNSSIIESLFREHSIDGYVRKARNDAKELKLALEAIAANQVYFPRHLTLTNGQKSRHEFSKYDITIISLLASGVLQKDIPDHLRKNKMKPSSLSSVEKRLNYIKEVYDFSKNEQLIAHCKDERII